MLRLIGLTAVALPFLEIAGFVWLGGKLGIVLTLVWVIAAMVAGLALLRHTGLQAVGRLRAALAKARSRAIPSSMPPALPPPPSC